MGPHEENKVVQNRYRRKTLAGSMSDKENGVLARAPSTSSGENDTPLKMDPSHSLEKAPREAHSIKNSYDVAETPSKTPSRSHRHRTRLPESTSGFYFKGLAKPSAESSFEAVSVYDGSADAAETSFISRASTSSGSESEDMLNKSVLSDTTELTASNFVLTTSSKQRFHWQSNIAHQNSTAADGNAAQKDNMEARLERNDEHSAVSSHYTSRPPLSSIIRDESRRHTLGQQLHSTFHDKKDDVSMEGQNDARRESWHGPSPPNNGESSDIQEKTKRLLTNLRSRKKERAQLFSRLSTASSNLSIDDQSPLRLGTIHSTIQGVSSPALIENNRIVTKGQFPSMAPTDTKGEDHSSPGKTDTTLLKTMNPSESKIHGTADTPLSRNTATSDDMRILDLDMTSTDDTESFVSTEYKRQSNVGKSPAGVPNELKDPVSDPIINTTEPSQSESNRDAMQDDYFMGKRTSIQAGEGKHGSGLTEITHERPRANENDTLDPDVFNLNETMNESSDVSSFDLRSPESAFVARATREKKESDSLERALGTKSAPTSSKATLPITEEQIQEAGHLEDNIKTHIEDLGPHTNPTAQEENTDDKALKTKRKPESMNEKKLSATVDISNADDTVNESDLDLWATSPADATTHSAKENNDRATSPSRKSETKKSSAERAELNSESFHLASEEPTLSGSPGSRESFLSERSGTRTTATSGTKLTPTKLNGTPRRIPNPSVDSPARNTRSRVALRKQFEDDKAQSDDKEEKQVVANIEERSPAPAGRLNSDREQDDVIKDATTSFSSILMNSSFRKASSVRKEGGPRKSVAFGSPEILKFNISSPPMSATPMPGKSRRKTLMPDDTVEIERDMKSLLESIDDPSAAPPNVRGSGLVRGTEFSQGARQQSFMANASVEIESDVNSSLDNADEEDTERHLDTKHRTASDKISAVDESEEVESDMDLSTESQTETSFKGNEDQTVGLEDNMAILLAQTQSPIVADTGDPFSSKRKLEMNDNDENTIELEHDINELLEAVEDPSNGASSTERGKKRRKSMASSRRFSLLPHPKPDHDESKFDDHAEESNHKDKEENEQPRVDSPEPLNQKHEDMKLSLSPDEIVEILKVERVYISLKDLIEKIGECFGNCGNSRSIDGMTVFVEEVCDHMERGLLPSISPEFFTDSDPQNRDSLLRLQSFVRSNDRDEIERTFGRITSALGKSEHMGWSSWLVHGSQQLLDHASTVVKSMLAEKQSIKQNMGLIERSERILYSCERKNVRQARRRSLQRRKVSWS